MRCNVPVGLVAEGVQEGVADGAVGVMGLEGVAESLAVATPETVESEGLRLKVEVPDRLPVGVKDLVGLRLRPVLGLGLEERDLRDSVGDCGAVRVIERERLAEGLSERVRDVVEVMEGDDVEVQVKVRLRLRLRTWECVRLAEVLLVHVGDGEGLGLAEVGVALAEQVPADSVGVLLSEGDVSVGVSECVGVALDVGVRSQLPLTVCEVHVPLKDGALALWRSVREADAVRVVQVREEEGGLTEPEREGLSGMVAVAVALCDSVSVRETLGLSEAVGGVSLRERRGV